MSWSYFLNGKLAARADEGVPVGQQVVLVDNSDIQNVTATGTWTTATSAPGMYGTNYANHSAGTGTDSFTWRLNIPQAGTYEVFVRYPQVSGAATDAHYTIAHGGGSTDRTIDQTTNTGTWVSMGSYTFAEGNTHTITLSDQASGTVVADAVKLVRDNTGDTDTERHDYTYHYDANTNLTTINDNSPGARVDTYAISYTGINQVEQVQEKLAGVVKNTTTFSYNENGAPLTTSHDRQYASYTYDPRDLLATVTNGTSPSDPDAKTTSYTYTDRGERLHEVKGNGNTVDYTYFLDGLLNTQVAKKPDATIVSQHTIGYDLNGNRTRDVVTKMNADNHAAYLSTTYDYTYDPRDRIAQVTKTGDGAGTESYIYDANNNGISQALNGATTTFTYDRNRLLTSTTGGVTSSYNYDPFGRLDTITAAGTIIGRDVYDGFDHISESRSTVGGATTATRYTYDPLDRTTSRTISVGSADEKTTDFEYLGLSGEVLDEEVAGTLTKSYRYSTQSERLAQITYNADGTTEDAYYGYNPHTDVELLTDSSGNTKATYGYTAYGANDDPQFTGVDKPDPANPRKEPYNAYRFNAKRWDQQTQTYDMGFRDYSPGLNRFLIRDTYNNALADVDLGLDPYTGNRYAFGAGNPISRAEIDGHDGGDPEPTILAPGPIAAEPVCGSGFWHAVLCFLGFVPIAGDPAMVVDAQLYRDEGNTARAEQLEDAAGASISISLGLLPGALFAAGARATTTIANDADAATTRAAVVDSFAEDAGTVQRTSTSTGTTTASTTASTSASATASSTTAGSRLARDIAIQATHPTPPPATMIGTIGRNPRQAAALQADIQRALNARATDTRVNQHQVNAAGIRVGINRPDLQYTLNGQRYYIEYETVWPGRWPRHAQRILANDPLGIVTGVHIP